MIDASRSYLKRMLIPVMTDELRLLSHYRKLMFFALHRFEGDNYARMGAYFADILVREVEEFMPLHDKKVLDVGGARGHFCRLLHEKRGCRAVNLDPSPGEPVWPDTAIGTADAIPFDNDAFDLVICRAVLEHVPPEKRPRSVNEIFRVTRPGGLAYIQIPPWFNPHAGHGLKPFHVLPFRLARWLRRITFGNTIQGLSLAEAGLFPITFRGMTKLISASGFTLRATRDAHFKMHFLTRIPILREILVPAVAFILSKPRPVVLTGRMPDGSF